MKQNGSKMVKKFLSGALISGAVLMGITAIQSYVVKENRNFNEIVVVDSHEEKTEGFAMGQALLTASADNADERGVSHMGGKQKVNITSTVSEEICNRETQIMIYNAALQYADELEGMTIVLTDGSNGPIQKVENLLYVDYEIALDVFTGVLFN